MNLTAVPFQILAALVIYIFNFSDGPATALVILIMMFAGTYRLRLLGILSLLFLILSTGGPRRMYGGEDLLTDSALNANSHPNLVIVKLVSLLLAMGAIAGAAAIAREKNSGKSLIINLVFLVVLMAMYAIAQGTYFGLVIHGTVIYFTYFFWFVSYSQPRLKIDQWPMLFPFWAGFTPWQTATVPRGISELDNSSRGQTFQQAAISFLMILGGLVTLEYLEVARQSIFGFLKIPSPVGIGLYRFVNLEIPTLSQWIISFVETALFLVQNAAVMGVTIGLVRILGFQIPFDIQYPWRAISYGDFLRRMFFYYGEVIVNFFVPLFDRLKDSPRLRGALSVGVGIFILSFVRELPLGLDRKYDFFFGPLRTLPFIALILIGLWLSEKIRLGVDANRWQRLGVMTLYFCFFSVAYNSLLFFKENEVRFVSRASLREFLSYMGNFIGL